MKVLDIDHLFFRLPDNFQGGFSAALRHLADYHENVVRNKKPQIGPVEGKVTRERKRHWKAFWDAVNDPDTNFRLHGAINMDDYTDLDNIKPIDINILES